MLSPRLSRDGWAPASGHAAAVGLTRPPVSSCGTGQEQDVAAPGAGPQGGQLWKETGDSRGVATVRAGGGPAERGAGRAGQRRRWEACGAAVAGRHVPEEGMARERLLESLSL